MPGQTLPDSWDSSANCAGNKSIIEDISQYKPYIDWAPSLSLQSYDPGSEGESVQEGWGMGLLDIIDRSPWRTDTDRRTVTIGDQDSNGGGACNDTRSQQLAANLGPMMDSNDITNFGVYEPTDECTGNPDAGETQMRMVSNGVAPYTNVDEIPDLIIDSLSNVDADQCWYRVGNAGNIADAYHFDPDRRVLPTGASYVCIVYDERNVADPTSFEALASEEYSDSLLLANPQSTTTGLLFLLWTVAQQGEGSYLDYWSRLMDNGVQVLGSWSDAYAAYENEEAPMVVSYSTDQVYASQQDKDMRRHQIGFPNDQGYAYVDGVGKFATTDRDELVRTFAEFLLDPEVQQETAVKNVGVPTVTNVGRRGGSGLAAGLTNELVHVASDVRNGETTLDALDAGEL